jgi:Zn finger protein HypA/HybF involved in hydrogenase expression
MTAAVEVREPDIVQARCEACGHNWKLHRHEAFTCPYCGNKPTEVTFYGNYAVLADEASRRWFA